MTEAVAKMVGRFDRMERIDQLAFHREIRSRFIETEALFELLTPNFDAMKGFFLDLGFEAREDRGDQILHTFGEGRVVSIRRPGVELHLRESSTAIPATPFNLWLTGYAEHERERFRHVGHGFQELTGIGDSFFQFTTPDGGTVII